MEPNDSVRFAGFWLRQKWYSGANAFRTWKDENVLAGAKTRGEGLRKYRTRLSRQIVRGEDDYSSDYSRRQSWEQIAGLLLVRPGARTPLWGARLQAGWIFAPRLPMRGGYSTLSIESRRRRVWRREQLALLNGQVLEDEAPGDQAIMSLL